jgi:superfamily II DNA or RNA helicase
MKLQDKIDLLMQAYRRLDPAEQTILKVLSVIYIPIIQTDLKTVLAKLGWTSESNELLADKINGALKKKWLDEGVVIEKGNRIKCSHLIEEVLTRKVDNQGLFDEVMHAAELSIPSTMYLDNNSYYRSNNTEERDLRSALYQNDIPALLDLLAAPGPFESYSTDMADSLVTMCNTPFDLSWFSQRELAIQFHVMECHLSRGSVELLPYTDEYFSFLEQLFQAGKLVQPNFLYLLLEQRLLRGKTEHVESLLANINPEKRYALLTSLHFLRGKAVEAMTSYQLGLKFLRKRLKKRTIYFQGLPSIFYILSIIKSGKSIDKKEALKCLEYLKMVSYDEPSISTSAGLLIDILSVLDNQKEFDQTFHLSREPYTNPTPLFSLLKALGCHWLGETISEKQILTLQKHCRQAFEEKSYWYAYESAELLRHLNKAENCLEIFAQQQQDEFTPRLVSLIEPTSAWQIALNALQEICQNNLPQSDTTNRDTRLAWLVEEDRYRETFSLSPRLQTRNKSGQWTKGRAVALSRLCYEADDIDDLSEADKAICNTIYEEAGYGYYSSPKYYLDQDRCFLAAVGHPNIYWLDQPKIQIEIKQADPELIVLNQKSKIHLQLSPSPDIRHVREGLSHYTMVQKEGLARLRITTFNREQLKIYSILGSNGLSVPSNAKAEVLNSISVIAPLLTIHSDIGGGNDSNIDIIEADPRLHLHLQAVSDGLRIECFIQPFTDGGPLFHPNEGGATVFTEIDGKRLQANRDLAQEATNRNLLGDQCPVLDIGENEWSLNDPELALEVLLKLQTMQDALVLSWPKGKKIALSRELSKEQFHMSVGKQRDWFELSGELVLDDGKVLAMKQLMSLLQQSPGRFLRLESGEVLALTKDLQKRLEAIRRFSDDGVFHPLASHAMDELTDGMEIKKNKLWQQQLTRIKQAQTLQPEVPSTLQAELRDYQAEGFSWLARLAHWGAGACLADDMGLGKTVQALALMLTRAPQGPTLVLAPTSVCMNWMEEIVRFSPTLKPHFFGALSGSKNRQQCLNAAGSFDVIVCTYGLLQSEAKALAEKQWHTIVADEAQAIKNPLTKRSKAAMALQGDFKMVTTGTPIENHLGELWNIFRFINPGLLGSLDHFKRRFSNPIENDNDAQSREHLKKLIRPFILRRLKSEVLTELPSRTEITIRVQPSEAESVMYEALRRQAMERIAQTEDGPGQQHIKVLAEITRLRLACCNPQLVMPETDIASEKLKAFSAVLDELLQNKHKALVFSQFVGHLSLIRKHLDKQGIQYQYLDGSTPTKKRQKAVNDFQSGQGDVFLISLKAGGAGLNLTAADYVLHMDPWWNPAVEDQASDRAHRMGQQRPVTIYRFVMKDTIEDKIVDLHQHKRDLANSLLEGSEMSGKMSVNAMLNLINEE